MTWVVDHLTDILGYAWKHTLLAGVPLVVGLLISLPLGWVARRYRRLYGVIIAGSGLLYTIPSLALFILMPLILGTRILDTFNVYVAMTLYTLALLVRTVADGLGAVPDATRQAAVAMGFTGIRRLIKVDLPLAIPVIASGLRVAAVSNVSIVSVASLVGFPQLGYYLTDGYQRSFPTEIIVGIVACVVLALIFDTVIRAGAWAMTPWLRVAR
ncbi:MAG: ABC transporter permease [Actinomycetota bacterium]|nr:ABC transporter permease [Actinomycetota bacterium]